MSSQSSQNMQSARTASNLFGALTLLVAGVAQAAPAPKVPDAEAQAHETWRAAIARTPTPQAGCYHAVYPNMQWVQTSCKTAPNRPYLPRNGHGGFTVGNGNDYAGVVSGILSSSVGSFPSVSGLKSEKGYGGAANTYSLQLNSQFFSTAACNNSSNPSNCLGWQQFVYSSSEQAAFMQYWLINYGNTCPSGAWMSYQGSCYRNSSAASVPQIAITQLPNLKISAQAVVNGNDTMTFTTASQAYSTTGQDTVTYLASHWNASEFNIVGDGGGSAAKFNRGTTLTVEITLNDGRTTTPTCQSNDGTTGETNNLNLGSCSAAGGSTPYVKFTESN